MVEPWSSPCTCRGFGIQYGRDRDRIPSPAVKGELSLIFPRIMWGSGRLFVTSVRGLSTSAVIHVETLTLLVSRVRVDACMRLEHCIRVDLGGEPYGFARDCKQKLDYQEAGRTIGLHA